MLVFDLEGLDFLFFQGEGFDVVGESSLVGELFFGIFGGCTFWGGGIIGGIAFF